MPRPVVPRLRPPPAGANVRRKLMLGQPPDPVPVGMVQQPTPAAPRLRPVAADAPSVQLAPLSTLKDFTYSGNRIVDVRDIVAWPDSPDTLATRDGSPISALRFLDSNGDPVAFGGGGVGGGGIPEAPLDGQQYGRQSAAWTVVAGGGSGAWDDITGKPATFPPSAHTHPASEITDFAEATDDRVAALLVAGANVTLSYNDAANSLTIASTAAGGGGGTVTSTSVVSANGLAGTVATPTTTPAITLSTSVNGMVKGNGTALSAATAGTDYMTPGNVSAAYQPLDTGLTALAGIATGIVANTATDAFAARTITGTASRVTVSNGNGVSGNPTLDISATYDALWAPVGHNHSATYQPLDATLTAVAAYNTNGLLTQTAADTFTGRTVTGTTNRISVTNGNGVSGNPTLDIAAAYDALWAPVSHTQTASTITDFSEAVDDRVAALLVAGSNVTLTYNDAANTLTVAAASASGTSDGNFMASGVGSVGSGVTSTATQIVWNTIVTGNAGGYYSTSTGRYTPPAGRHRIFVQTYGTLSSAATTFTLTLLKNGVTNTSQVLASTAGAAFWTESVIDVVVDASGTDYWETWLSASNSSSGIDGMFSAFPISGSPADIALAVSKIDQNAQTGSYTLLAADAGKHLYHAVAAAAATYTIPANSSVAYPIGTTLSFVNDSANAVTIAITTDTLVLSPGTTTGSRTLATGGVATALKVTSTRWVINGTGLT